jgi:hypothetical protein
VAAQWECHLDWVAWRQIETVKPACRPAGKHRRRGKTPAGGGKDNVGVIGNCAQCVKATTEPAPARTEQVILGQPVQPGFLEIEGTRGERYRNQWSPRHDPPSVGKVASKWNCAC